jgi:hypothetical protein
MRIDRRVLQPLWFCFALLAMPADTLQAQRTLAVALGSKVRVRPWDDPTWRVGRLMGIATDTIRLQSCASCAVDVYLLPSLSAVHVSMGRTGRATTVLKGAVLGTLVGLGSGWLYGWIKTRSCKPGDDLCGLDYLAVPFLGAGGLVIGTVIGSTFRYDDWQPALIR